MTPPVWVLLLVAVAVLPIALTTLVSAWEKRLVWPYAPLDEALEPTAYMAQTSALAQAMGFERIGPARPCAISRSQRGRVAVHCTRRDAAGPGIALDALAAGPRARRRMTRR